MNAIPELSSLLQNLYGFSYEDVLVIEPDFPLSAAEYTWVEVGEK
jgi:hypothetical protein